MHPFAPTVALSARLVVGLMQRKHELGFGLTYSQQRFNADARDAAFPFADVGDFNRWDGSYPKPAWGPSYVSDNYKTTQTAGYAVARFSLADPLKLIVGGRLSNWQQDINVSYTGPGKIEHDNVFTPYAGLVYDINQTYSAYASYTDIFQPQLQRDRFGNYLDPIEGSNYELGVKGQFFDGKLNASAAIFQIRQDNLAQRDAGQFVPGTNRPEEAYYGARGATSRGYESDIGGQLAPGWDLSFGWSQFRAQDADDKDINTYIPRKLLKLFTSYRLPGEWRGLTFGGGINWESSNYTMSYNPSGNLERVQQSSFALVSLMARYAFNPALSLQLNIGNLLDETFYSQIGFYDQLAYGPPRNVSLLLRYNFP